MLDFAIQCPFFAFCLVKPITASNNLSFFFVAKTASTLSTETRRWEVAPQNRHQVWLMWLKEYDYGTFRSLINTHNLVIEFTKLRLVSICDGRAYSSESAIFPARSQIDSGLRRACMRSNRYQADVGVQGSRAIVESFPVLLELSDSANRTVTLGLHPWPYFDLCFSPWVKVAGHVLNFTTAVHTAALHRLHVDLQVFEILSCGFHARDDWVFTAWRHCPWIWHGGGELENVRKRGWSGFCILYSRYRPHGSRWTDGTYIRPSRIPMTCCATHTVGILGIRAYQKQKLGLAVVRWTRLLQDK